MIQFLTDNAVWITLIFAAIGGIYKFISDFVNEKKDSSKQQGIAFNQKNKGSEQGNIDLNNSIPTTGIAFSQDNSNSKQGDVKIINAQFYNDNSGNSSNNENNSSEKSLEEQKIIINILFIDDDKNFEVVNILKRSGWKNTKWLSDIDNMDSQIVSEIDIFFVDIDGVGKKLNFKDQGLGLSLALKKKYPTKKVIIYSADPKRDITNTALRECDGIISKNADSFEFTTLIENLSNTLINGK